MLSASCLQPTEGTHVINMRLVRSCGAKPMQMATSEDMVIQPGTKSPESSTAFLTAFMSMR